MENNNFMEGYYKYCVMLIKLAYLNILWIAFILLGLGIFGLFPSTIAMFSVVRQWIKGNTEESLFHQFWSTYKKEFIKANLVGLGYALIGVILYIDILYFRNPSGVVMLTFYYFFWLVTVIYVILGLFIFPVYVHYQNKWWQYYKSAIMVMVMNPFTVLAFIVIVPIAGVVLRALPGLLPFFSGSIIAYVLMLLSFRAFNKVETKAYHYKVKTLELMDS